MQHLLTKLITINITLWIIAWLKHITLSLTLALPTTVTVLKRGAIRSKTLTMIDHRLVSLI